jgi:hypothetical protein
MNERIRELELQAAEGTVNPNGPFTAEEFNNFTKKFAALVATDEREACAKVCVNISKKNVWEFENEIEAIEECVSAIRARGESE